MNMEETTKTVERLKIDIDTAEKNPINSVGKALNGFSKAFDPEEQAKNFANDYKARYTLQAFSKLPTKARTFEEFLVLCKESNELWEIFRKNCYIE